MLVQAYQVPHVKLPKITYIVEPCIPANAVVLLHGDAGIGKSPLTWSLANAVSSGVSWFGLPANQAHVLYVEVDSPASIVLARLKAAHFMNHFDLLFLSDTAVDVLAPRFRESKAYEEILKTQNILFVATGDEYGLVIVNTLRKVHKEDDIKSYVPNLVYKAFQGLFPSAAIVFVHHDRKASQWDSALPVGDKAGGSKHWVDDAHVQLHLVGHPKALKLEQLKNQNGPPIASLQLRLEANGVTMSRRAA